MIEDYRTGGAAPYFLFWIKNGLYGSHPRIWHGKNRQGNNGGYRRIAMTGMRMEQKVKTFADTFVPSSFIYIQHSDGCQNWKNFLALL